MAKVTGYFALVVAQLCHVYRIGPNRNSPPAILLRESYRDAGKIKKRTIANLSDWPTEIVEGLRTLLKGGKVAPAAQESIGGGRAWPPGQVGAVLGTLRTMAARCRTAMSRRCWAR